jgi:hypothetical protein
MWNRPNITTKPRRSVAPPSLSRWMARSQVARCESTAPFDTPVDPLVRKTTAGSSLDPTRGGATGDASACHPGPVVITGTPNRPATARAGASVSAWVTTSRGVSVSNASIASGSVKLGLIGVRTAPAFDTPYASSSASSAVGPHHSTRSSGATPSARSRWAARLAPASSSANVRASSPRVAPMR